MPAKGMLIRPRQNIFTLAEERTRKINGYIYGKNENLRKKVLSA